MHSRQSDYEIAAHYYLLHGCMLGVHWGCSPMLYHNNALAVVAQMPCSWMSAALVDHRGWRCARVRRQHVRRSAKGRHRAPHQRQPLANNSNYLKTIPSWDTWRIYSEVHLDFASLEVKSLGRKGIFQKFEANFAGQEWTLFKTSVKLRKYLPACADLVWTNFVHRHQLRIKGNQSTPSIARGNTFNSGGHD